MEIVNGIRLSHNVHERFLGTLPVDQLTGKLLLAGDMVYVCRDCSCVWHESSWRKEESCLRCKCSNTARHIPDEIPDDRKSLKIIKFQISPDTNGMLGDFLIEWMVLGSKLVWIDPLLGEIGSSGCIAVKITDITSYSLVAVGSIGGRAEMTIEVDGGNPMAQIIRFEPESYEVIKGLTTRIFWETHGADTVYLEPGPTLVSRGRGMEFISPIEETNYRLAAYDQFARASFSNLNIKVVIPLKDIPVHPLAPPPNDFAEIISEFSMLQGMAPEPQLSIKERII
jgi:hypothetical protein